MVTGKSNELCPLTLSCGPGNDVDSGPLESQDQRLKCSDGDSNCCHVLMLCARHCSKCCELLIQQLHDEVVLFPLIGEATKPREVKV